MRRILKELSIHSLTYMLGSIAISCSSILLLPLYTRCLSKTDYGVLEILDSANSIYVILVMAGLGAALGKFHNESADESEQKLVFNTIFWFVFLCTSISIAVLALFGRQLAHVLLGSESFASLINLELAILWVAPSFLLGTIYLNVHKRPGTFLLLTLVKLVINVLLNIYFIIHLSYGAKGMLLGELISTFLVGTVLLWGVIRKNGFGFSPSLLRKALIFGLPFVPSLLCAAIMHRADRYLLMEFTSLDAVGVYGLGYKLPFMLGSLLIQSFGRIWSSSALFEIAKQENSKQIFARVTTYFCAVVIVSEISLAILTNTVLRVLTTPAYYSAGPVVQIIGVGVCVYSLHTFFLIPAVIMNKTWYLPFSFFLAAVSTIVLDFLLLPRFGYIAAAWVMLASYTFFSGSLYFTLNRFYSIPYEFKRISGLFLLGTALVLANGAIPLANPFFEFLKELGFAMVMPVFIVFGPFLRRDESIELAGTLGRFSPGVANWYRGLRKIGP